MLLARSTVSFSLIKPGPIYVAGERVYPGPRWTYEEIQVSKWDGLQEKEMRMLYAAAWKGNADLMKTVDPAAHSLLVRYAQDRLDLDFHRLLDMHERVWVARVRGRIIGMVCLLKGGELKKLAVDPMAVGIGAASKLVAVLEKYCKAKYGRVYLETGSFMPLALRFYHRHGYKFLGYRMYPNALSENGRGVGVARFEKEFHS